MRRVACFKSKFVLLARATSEVSAGSLKLAHHAAVIGAVVALLCFSAFAPGCNASCVQPAGVSGLGGVKSGPSVQLERRSVSRRREDRGSIGYSIPWRNIQAAPLKVIS